MPRNALIRITFLSSILFSTCAAPSLAAQTETFSNQVNRICAGAVLFEGSHEIGTRGGAVAVSNDILETGTRRLNRGAAVPRPASQAATIGRWLEVERRLVAAYARDYLLIWDAIDEAYDQSPHGTLSARLYALVHDPDNLKQQARKYELKLRLTDCTGGGS